MKESLNDWQRVEAVRTHYNMNRETFCQHIGLNRSTYSNMISRESSISHEVLKAILERWPEISADWLVMGRGLMTRDANTALEVSQSSVGDNAIIANDVKVEPGDIHSLIDLHQRNEVLSRQLVLMMSANKTLVETNSRLIAAIKCTRGEK